METHRTTKILIAAMGGEGGGVLTNWLVDVARQQGYGVQSTSIPGVAQRTGATTYYIELSKNKEAAFCLSPMAGDVDIFASSEYLETSRAIQNGYVTPDNTFLIASTHRVYTLDEKMQSGVGVFEHEKLEQAASEASRASLLFDMTQAGLPLNSVMLGAIAAQLPFKQEVYEDIIRATGLNIALNLKGFLAGFKAVSQVEAQAFSNNDSVKLGVERLTHYQNKAYATRYLASLEHLRETLKDEEFMQEVARLLALRMSYEDIAYVAKVKTSKDRFATVEREVKAGARPHVIIEYFKPGLEELAGFMPPRVGKWLLAHIPHEKTYFGLQLKSNTIFGFLLLKLLACGKFLRPFGLRASQESTQIKHWLDLITQTYAISPALASEVVQLANLIKGYGDTYKRGLTHFNAIVETIVSPFLKGEMALEKALDAILSARKAAQKDPEGELLAQTLSQIIFVKEEK